MVRVFRRLVIFALLLFGAAGFSACGSGDGGETTTALPPSATARELAEAVNFDGVHSGNLEVNFGIDNQGRGEDVNMRMFGSFMRAGREDPPRLDMAGESRGTLAGRKVEFEAGLSLLPGRALVSYDAARPYRPDRSTYEELRSKFESAQQEGDQGDAMACPEAAEGVEFSRLMHNLEVKSRHEDLDGTPVTWVEGELDVEAAIDALNQLAEDPACGTQLEAVGPLSSAQIAAVRGAIEKAVRKTQVLFAVDEQGVLRELSIEATASGIGGEKLEVELAYSLGKVNEVTELTELPLRSRSAPFPVLLRRFGTSLSSLRAADGGELLGGLLEVVGRGLAGR